MFLGFLDPDPLVRDPDPVPCRFFYHQAKIERKTLIPTVTSWWLFIFEK
jgi:hypothetical protein